MTIKIKVRIIDGIASGYGEHYVPVKFPAKEEIEENSMVKVKLTGLEQGEDPFMVGEIIWHKVSYSLTNEIDERDMEKAI